MWADRKPVVLGCGRREWLKNEDECSYCGQAYTVEWSDKSGKGAASKRIKKIGQLDCGLSAKGGMVYKTRAGRFC